MPRPASRLRSWSLHGYRCAVLAAIVWLVHDRHAWVQVQTQGSRQAAVNLERVRQFFPQAARLSDWRPEHGGQTVVDVDARPLGYVVQTSPASDAIIGYSGPTNTLIAFDTEDRILGLEILRCGDTPDHFQAVLADRRFLHSFNGRTWEEARERRQIDGVSGATLTSLAIVEGIARRLGGPPHSYRFPDPLTVAEAKPFLPFAATLTPQADRPGLERVEDAAGKLLGFLARTSPTADDMMGFQGPTDTLLALDDQQRVLGIAIRRTYETKEYMQWVQDDKRFLARFNGRTLDDLAGLDLAAAGIEGVSGATMTSMAIAQSLVRRAQSLKQAPTPAAEKTWSPTARDIGTAVVALAGLLFAFTSLRGRRWLRVAFQVVLIAYLGFVNGDMLSQALLVGWAQSGVAWRFAPGLVVLVAVALLVPLATRRQVYCHHLCPHGAAQQLVKNLVPWHLRLPRWLARGLATIPFLLLGGVLVVAMLPLPFNLAAIEPFDAYLFRIAGWSSLSLAVVGLVAALFLPLAYCRFGCPTGAVLNYIRWHGPADHLTRRDAASLALFLLALTLRLL